jgi:prolyl-tRNA synthetase
MGRFKDKAGRDMVLAMTHEEVVADLARREIDTYRQLPQLIYHIQTKWRDDPRPRAGLIRVREFTMKDSYSLDADEAGLDKQYRAHYQAYFNIFHRCGLDVAAVGADTGMMGGSMSHEYMVLTDIGEDTLLFCDGCGYAANRQVARLQKPAAEPETPRPIEKIATPDVTTIDDLTKFLDIPKAKTAKAVFMAAEMADQRIGGSADQREGGSANLPLSPSPSLPLSNTTSVPTARPAWNPCLPTSSGRATRACPSATWRRRWRARSAQRCPARSPRCAPICWMGCSTASGASCWSLLTHWAGNNCTG